MSSAPLPLTMRLEDKVLLGLVKESGVEELLSTHQKSMAWDQIAWDYNQATGLSSTMKSLQKRWSNLRQRARKRAQEQEPQAELDENTSLLLGVMRNGPTVDFEPKFDTDELAKQIRQSQANLPKATMTTNHLDKCQEFTVIRGLRMCSMGRSCQNQILVDLVAAYNIDAEVNTHMKRKLWEKLRKDYVDKTGIKLNRLQIQKRYSNLRQRERKSSSSKSNEENERQRRKNHRKLKRLLKKEGAPADEDDGDEDDEVDNDSDDDHEDGADHENDDDQREQQEDVDFDEEGHAHNPVDDDDDDALLNGDDLRIRLGGVGAVASESNEQVLQATLAAEERRAEAEEARARAEATRMRKEQVLARLATVQLREAEAKAREADLRARIAELEFKRKEREFGEVGGEDANGDHHGGAGEVTRKGTAGEEVETMTVQL